MPLLDTLKYRIRDMLVKPRMVVQSKPVVLDNTDRCTNPIFILGAHRSGTTLVRRILNAHSQIACPPETFFLRHFCSMLKDKQTVDGFEGLGYKREETADEIRKWASHYHEAFRVAEDKKRWADKTPEYVENAPELHSIFPNAQFVCVIRHPYDIVCSIYKRGWKLSTYDKDPLLNAIEHVRSQINKLRAFIDANPQETYELRYEKLTASPEEELQSLFKWLNEDWETDVLKFNDKAQNYGRESPDARVGNEIKARSNSIKSLKPEDQEKLKKHGADLLTVFCYE